MIDNRTRPVTASFEAEYLENLTACAPDIDAIHARCAAAYPEFGLSPGDFREAVIEAINKYLIGFAKGGVVPSTQEIRRFLGGIQDLDLYLTLACARGNEQAWWQFDRQHRSFIERLARRLASSGMDANEVIDSVYVELFGTKVVGGVRQSKFRTYTGRGTLRGWLRTVTWHAAVDLYRGRQAEIPLEDWSGSVDETRERQPWRGEARGTERLMLAKVVRERYLSVTVAALDQSLATLDDRETLLLLYYHVEGLKLREIARIVEEHTSPIRRWFQRKPKRRAQASPGRVHESTVMRWLERVYRKVLDGFRNELEKKHGLNAAEIEICLDIAKEDLAQGVSLDLRPAGDKHLSKEEAGKSQTEGAS